MSDDTEPDPLAALNALVEALRFLVPRSCQYTPAQWTQFEETFFNTRRVCRDDTPTTFAALRRWFRDGLDDTSFAAARSEVDEAERLVVAFTSTGIPEPIFGCRAPHDDGSIESVALLSVNQVLSLRGQFHLVETAVARLARWRDCRKVHQNGDGANDYVTLDQLAATVNRSKDTLERRLNEPDSTMPKPDVEGGGGKPHEWRWARIRRWLMKEFGRELPERFPGSRI